MLSQLRGCGDGAASRVEMASSPVLWRGGSKRLRALSTDLEDDVANQWFKAHVKIDELKHGKLFPYTKTKHQQGPGWPDLKNNRHALFDLIVFTRGRLIRFARFEKQFAKFLEECGIPDLFNQDQARPSSRGFA